MMAAIKKNDFNLNISRYISTPICEADIDLTATHGELVAIEKQLRQRNVSMTLLHLTS